MRVVTTCSKQGFDDYGYRWLEGRKHWPTTDFQFYTEGYSVDCPGKDFRDLPEFSQWKLKHARYLSPSWKYNVVGFAHKVFAACDALYDYDGIGVWLDADCVTFKDIPADLIAGYVRDVYMAIYARTGMYTETGLWIMDCSYKGHREFLDKWRDYYLSEKYKNLLQWHDCMTLDATLRATGVPTFNLSGEHGRLLHPQAVSELGQYVDHCKGPRKALGRSPENRAAA